MLCHQISGIHCATDLSDPELVVFSFCCRQDVIGFPVFDGAAPTAEGMSSYCCSICPDSSASFVSQLSYCVGCWPTRWPGLRVAPRCSTLTQHHTTARLSVSMTKSPRYGDPRQHPLDVERLVLGHLGATASESPSIVIRRSSSYIKESNTTPSACSRYRPIHPRRVTRRFPDCAAAFFANECGVGSVGCQLRQSS